MPETTLFPTIPPDRILPVLNSATRSLQHRRQYFMAMLTIEAPDQLRHLMTPDLLNLYGEMQVLRAVDPESLERTIGAIGRWINGLSRDQRDQIAGLPATQDPELRHSPDQTARDVLSRRHLPEIERLSTGPDGRFDWSKFRKLWVRRHEVVGQEIDRVLTDWQTRHHLPNTWIRPLLRAMLDRAVLAHISGDDPFDGMRQGLSGFWMLSDECFRPESRNDFAPTFLDGGHLRPEWLLGPDDDRTEWREALGEALRAAVDPFLDWHLEAPLRRQAVNPTIRRPDQFRWLIRYQVLHETYDQIAATIDGAAGHRQTVAQAVKRLANTLGLTLRDPERVGGRPGRRPRTKRIDRRTADRMLST